MGIWSRNRHSGLLLKRDPHYYQPEWNTMPYCPRHPLGYIGCMRCPCSGRGRHRDCSPLAHQQYNKAIDSDLFRSTTLPKMLVEMPKKGKYSQEKNNLVITSSQKALKM